MSNPICRTNGLYQWDARVAAVRNNMRQAVLVTVFCDTRQEAIDAACELVFARGYRHPTVDHITKLRS
jgi:AcrR family transcriptional regulator